jgi:hypothetical protein
MDESSSISEPGRFQTGVPVPSNVVQLSKSAVADEVNLQENAVVTPARRENLADRARARRAEALERRGHCVVHTTLDGDEVRTYLFRALPRIDTLVARTGSEAYVLSVEVHPPRASGRGPEGGDDNR